MWLSRPYSVFTRSSVDSDMVMEQSSNKEWHGDGGMLTRSVGNNSSLSFLYAYQSSDKNILNKGN